jgi:DNA-binding transcriptional ArsR family regulator
MGKNTESDRLSLTFAALADPTRREILEALGGGDVTVSELAAPFAMTMPAITKHLKVLERAGLITRSRESQKRPCRLRTEPLQAADAWIQTHRRGREPRLERPEDIRPKPPRDRDLVIGQDD